MIIQSENMQDNDDFQIEDESSQGEGENNEENEDELENTEAQQERYDGLLNGQIEPIVEEDGEESKYMPTPQKQITSKANDMKAIGLVKALKAKEMEKRLEPESTINADPQKFKSADAQKPKATLNENMSNRQLPPKIPGRSSTSNDYGNKNPTVPSHLKNYNKWVPSTTKASTTSETPKSISNSTFSHKPKPSSSNVLNQSKNSIESTSKIDPATSRALMLYETPTVASQQKQQEAYK